MSKSYYLQASYLLRQSEVYPHFMTPELSLLLLQEFAPQGPQFKPAESTAQHHALHLGDRFYYTR